MNKVAWLIGLIAVLVAIAACKPEGSTGNPTGGQQGQGGTRKFGAITVEATIARIGTLQVERTTAGSVIPVDQSQVASPVSGIVAKVYRKAGDWVTSGTAVVQLDDTQQKLALKTAQSTLENAKLNLSIAQDTTTQSNPKLVLQVQSAESAVASAKRNQEAMQALYKIKGASANDVDNAAAQLSTAQANLEAAKLALDQNKNADTQSLSQLRIAVTQADLNLQQAQLNLDRLTITAPFNGQISQMNAVAGSNVSTSSVVFTLVSAERQISFNIPPIDAPSLVPGTAIKFNYGGNSLAVRVSQSPSAPINGVVPMTATLYGGQNIAFGAVGTIFYTLNLAQGVIVPMAAIQSEETQNFVFTIVDGKAHQQRITILGESGSQAAVSGLDSGLQIINNPPPGLLEGVAVQLPETPTRSQRPNGDTTNTSGKDAKPSGSQAPQQDGAPANRTPYPGQNKPTGSDATTSASQSPNAQPGAQGDRRTGNREGGNRRRTDGATPGPGGQAPSGSGQP